MAPGSAQESNLNYAAHIRYWRRNLKTFLPNHYTGNDSNRMMLGLFILSALDILGDLHGALSPEERQGYIDWVYHCQLPEGCFRPAPATDFGAARNDSNKIWDPAHMAGTFFALLILVVLGDDMQRVKRREILQWLTKMQKEDGGFGETLGQGDQVEGGDDPRFGYMAFAIRWILRGDLEGAVDGVPDINVDKFVECVRAAESYDGGMSEAPYHESHAGFASCAISALYFADRLPVSVPDGRLRGLANLQSTLYWLAARQTLTLEDGDAVDTFKDDADSTGNGPETGSFVKLRSYPFTAGEPSLPGGSSPTPEIEWVGVNGRLNKIGDTCYAFWVCQPLQLLGHLDIIDRKPVRRWLLDKTQHLVGGFGKLPGEYPDAYHSFLGLQVLSMFGEAGLQEVDPALSITTRARHHLESLPWRRKLLGLGDMQDEDLASLVNYATISGG